MPDVRETVSWLLQIEGDLKTEADQTAKAIREIGSASDLARKELRELQAQMKGMDSASAEYATASQRSKELTAQIEKNAIATKTMREEQQVANEQSKVAEKNFMGLVGVVGAVTIGITTATAAIASFVAKAVEANDHLRQMGVDTGDAGKSIGAYKVAVDGLTTSVDKLFVSLSGPGFDRLSKFADILSAIADKMDSGQAGISGTGTLAWYVATMGMGPALSGAVDGTLNGASNYLGGPPPPAGAPYYSGPDYGPFFDRGDFGTAPDYGPSPDALAGVLAGRSAKNLKMLKGYQQFVTAAPGVSGRGVPGFEGIDGAVLPPQVANLAGTVAHDVFGGAGLDIAYQQLAAQAFPSTPRTPIDQTAVAARITQFGSGNLASTLGAINPIAGAVAAVAPDLGGTFDKLEHALVHLPEQLVDGIGHIVDELPEFIGKVLPDFIAGIIAAVPEIAIGLLSELPAILISVFTGLFEELPKALANALRDIVLPGADLSPQEKTAFKKAGYAAAQAGGGVAGLQAFHDSLGDTGSTRRGRAGQVHLHIHGGSTQDQIRSARKLLGPYGLNETFDPLVTS